MNAVWTIVRVTFLQQVRNKLWLAVLLYAGIMSAASLLLGAVAADAELTVIVDLGLAAAELLGLLVAAMGAVTLVLEEMESKTAYLILTRPVPRASYVVGRFLGLLGAVLGAVALMGLVHVGILLLKGWQPSASYFACYPFMALKVTVVASVALFFSLFATSQASSVSFTAFFWLLGHFGPELEFLAVKSRSVAAAAGVKAFLFVLPRLDFLTYRDLLEVPGVAAGPLLARGAAYAALYTGACLLLSATLFSRREF